MGLKETEYLVVNNEARFKVAINDYVSIKKLEKLKYVGNILQQGRIGRN